MVHCVLDPSRLPCPPERTILQFLSDDLAAEALLKVSTHVAECTNCRRVLDRLSDDAELREWQKLALRVSVEPGSTPPADLIERLHALPGTSAGRSAGPLLEGLAAAGVLRQPPRGWRMIAHLPALLVRTVAAVVLPRQRRSRK